VAVALLVAAGSGERLGAGRPKAFVALAGRPMLHWSVRAIQEVAAIELLVVAMPPPESWPPGSPETVDLGDRAPPHLRPGRSWGLTTAFGGPTRSHSVRRALEAARVADDESVVVHDAARPLATPELFERTLDALDEADAAIAAAPVTDTIKQGDADRRVTATLDRSGLWAVQTPQAFRAGALRRALDVGDDVLAAATDDAWLVERAGGTVRLVESPPENLKVTTPLDLRVAELLLRERERC
jgi:2-C-methyl-D-erythritol 4-phosphate cytidylyltransferase